MGGRRREADYAGGMTHEEIAKRLGISRVGVGKIERRALEKLRGRLKELPELQQAWTSGADMWDEADGDQERS